MRFLNVIKPVADVGDKLGKAVDAYNKAVGSMGTRLMPALRKMKESPVSPEEPPTLEPLEQNPRLPLDVEEQLLPLRDGDCRPASILPQRSALACVNGGSAIRSVDPHQLSWESSPLSIP